MCVQVCRCEGVTGVHSVMLCAMKCQHILTHQRKHIQAVCVHNYISMCIKSTHHTHAHYSLSKTLQLRELCMYEEVSLSHSQTTRPIPIPTFTHVTSHSPLNHTHHTHRVKQSTTHTPYNNISSLSIHHYLLCTVVGLYVARV